MSHDFIDKIPLHPSDQTIPKTEKLTVIRNFTLEPHFDTILNFYAPQIEIEYCYLDLWLRNTSNSNDDVFMILHLPYLVEDSYYSLYSIANDERNCIVQQQSNALISILYRYKLNQSRMKQTLQNPVNRGK